MNRSSFIKSIAMMIAAPKILGELQVIKPKIPVSEVPLNYGIDASSGISYTSIACWFKISNEMEKDSGYIEYLFNDVHSFLWRNCKQVGIDLSKPFKFQIGYGEDDFTRNLKTGVITQRIPV